MKPRDDASRPAHSPRHQRDTQDQQFDSLARNVARGFSRRQVLAGLGAAVIGAIGVSRSPVAAEDVPTDSVVIIEGPVDGGVIIPEEAPVDLNVPCGGTYCTVGQYCCNESCGICAPIGGACTQEFCGETCGPTTCGYGEVCCNASCGICVPPGYACAQAACEVCGDVTCRPGESCCNPVASICVPPGYACAN
jgi:hypothetical protein